MHPHLFDLSSGVVFTFPGWIIPLLSALGGLLGGLAGGYFSKRGEIRAIQRDLDIVVKQTQEITEAAEQIKADIGNDVWVRQKKWELKKEVILRAIDRLSTTRLTAMWLSSVYRSRTNDTSPRTTEDEKAYWMQYNKWLDRVSESSDRFESSLLEIEVVGKAEVIKEFNDVATILRTIVFRVLDEEKEPRIVELTSILKARIPPLVEAIREEMKTA